MDKLPTNPSGAPVLTCDLDEKCVTVDCEDFLPELPPSLADNPEVTEYMEYFCGLDYLAKKHPSEESPSEE